ncbi:MAG: hypothetical protein AAF663_00705 [Planctomycetota bacterium]
MKTLTTLTAMLAVAAAANAATVPLASTMDADSFISESPLTAGFAQIGLGDGSLGSIGANTGDADGLYDITDFGQPNPGLFGSGFDIFPREANFLVGSLETEPVTGSGVEVVAITSLDTSEFWSPDPARTDFNNFPSPTVISDISDAGLGMWFFNGPGAITFGPLDSSDTVTFTDGLLTSIDLEVATTFTGSRFGLDLEYSGAFSISGDEVSFQINDSEDAGFFGVSTLVADLTGTVGAVGSFAVPEPATGVLVVFCAAAAPFRRRR